MTTAIRLAAALCLVAACQPNDAPGIGEREQRKIVGPNNLTNPLCFAPAQLERQLAESVAQYQPANYSQGGKRPPCTAVLVTRDDHVLVPDECRTTEPGVFGFVTFDLYSRDLDCDGPPTGPNQAGEVYRVENEVLDSGNSGFMVAKLLPNATGPASSKHRLAKLGPALGSFANTSDELILAAMHRTGGIQVDPSCHVTTTWQGVTSHKDALHNCDTYAVTDDHENAIGGALFYGPSPTSPDSATGRLVGMHIGPHLPSTGLNRARNVKAIAAAGGVLAPFLTPGNFVPLASRHESRPAMPRRRSVHDAPLPGGRSHATVSSNGGGSVLCFALVRRLRRGRSPAKRKRWSDLDVRRGDRGGGQAGASR
ncbi:MAG: hypothetical protein MUF34_20060 [Polyangiaceae bacterium]|jgi:hypothetical protein|nr:hypothetical protein [Polyangiaceae bacterium]